MALDPAAYDELRAMGAELGTPPAWPLAMLYLESRLKPELRAPTGCGGRGCSGMSMIDDEQLRAKGVDPAQYVTWPASRQLRDVIRPWYRDTVKRYLGHPPRSVGVFYALNLAPGRVLQSGDAADVVLYASPDPRYTGNKPLDVNADGRITIADLDSYMQKLMLEPAYKAEAAKVGGADAKPPRPNGPSFATYMLGFVVAIVAAGRMKRR